MHRIQTRVFLISGVWVTIPIKTTKKHLCHQLHFFLYIYKRKTLFLSVLRGEVSTVGERSCKNGYLHRGHISQG